MPFNGSGVFNRVYSWALDLANNVKITASRMDTEMDGLAAGLSNCVTRDGQSAATADLPMGSHKHTGVTNAAARDQYAAAGQVQDGSLVWCTVGGTANAIELTPSPAITAYAAGQKFAFKAMGTNTGATTVAVSGLTAKDVRQKAVAIAAGTIVSGATYEIRYDGTAFQLPGGGTMLLGWHTVGMLPGNLKPRTSNGCTPALYDDTTSGADFVADVTEFDGTTAQVGYAHIPMPAGSGGGDIKVQVSARLPSASSSQTGIFSIKARYVRHDDNPATVSWGTAGTVTLTATSTAADLLVSSVSSAITPGGTYSDACSLQLRFERDTATDTGAGKLQFFEGRVLIQYDSGADA